MSARREPIRYDAVPQSEKTFPRATVRTTNVSAAARFSGSSEASKSMPNRTFPRPLTSCPARRRSRTGRRRNLDWRRSCSAGRVSIGISTTCHIILATARAKDARDALEIRGFRAAVLKVRIQTGWTPSAPAEPASDRIGGAALLFTERSP